MYSVYATLLSFPFYSLCHLPSTPYIRIHSRADLMTFPANRRHILYDHVVLFYCSLLFCRTQGKEYAIKVYKTSILVFKDRDKYVSGEYRYRHGYCRSNPRKMVKVRKLKVAKILNIKKKNIWRPSFAEK